LHDRPPPLPGFDLGDPLTTASSSSYIITSELPSEKVVTFDPREYGHIGVGEGDKTEADGNEGWTVLDFAGKDEEPIAAVAQDRLRRYRGRLILV
jgi:hypothetical protein